MYRTVVKLVLSLMFVLFAQVSSAQVDGAELFDDQCADCHSVGEGDMKGPDLLDVKQRHPEEWLLTFISSSKTMIDNGNGDPAAVAIWKKFKKKKMPNIHSSDEEIKAILQYIASFSKIEAPVEMVAAVPSIASTEKTSGTVIASATANPIQSVSNAKGDDRIKELEDKVDLLLRYHRRTAAIEISKEDIKNGKGLFSGKIPFKNGAPACVSCHNTRAIDTLNWNPSALDLIERYSEKRGEDVELVLANPTSRRMKDVLDEKKLTERETYTVKAYLQTIEKSGLDKERVFPKRMVIFILLALLIVIAFIDLVFTKKFKYKFVLVLIILIGTAVEGNTLIYEGQNLGITHNYQPEQPIKFSHRIHAGENGIQCLYCHSTAEYSKISGIPYDDICINCHYKIKSGTNSGTFEINKIIYSIKNDKPIKWVKIHNLPDYVFYSHAQHVGAGKLECKECHGEVEKMDRVKQVASLSMHWCIDCHRKTNVQFEENEFYTKYKTVQKDLKSGKIDHVKVDDLGGNDCQKCHY